MDIDTLTKIITEAAKASFTEFRGKYGREQIIGYSILSHDTADSCGPVVATKQGLEDFNYGPKENFSFVPVEWDKFDTSSFFDKVNDELIKLYNAGDYEADPDWHEKFREFIFEANVRALEQLIKEGFFGLEEQRDNLFILFSLSDSETYETHEPGWSVRLNTKNVAAKYASWRNNFNHA